MRGFHRHTEVVEIPQSSTGGVGVGAAGVSMNSNSSEASECVFAIWEKATEKNTLSSPMPTRMNVPTVKQRRDKLKIWFLHA